MYRILSNDSTTNATQQIQGLHALHLYSGTKATVFR